jgi:hypothetical protein
LSGRVKVIMKSGSALPQHLDLSWIIPSNRGILQIQFSNKPDCPKSFKTQDPIITPPNNDNNACLTPPPRNPYHMDPALAWALRLTGLHDRDKFKALDSGLRTWDQWQFNDCDDRFGSA